MDLCESASSMKQESESAHDYASSDWNDALRGDVEMIQDASNSDRARIMKAYDNAVELDCMLKDMDGATDDMLKHSETIRDSLREVVMGGRSGIIYRGGTE